ncbi:SRPBCC domain-containing protein [Flavilitoribacter nigricans]|uniref:SRPBCC domain-containing protein n=1 Tax=Flavilitoribacter nigricans TaxID=70997 RepID=UPI0014760CA1|nr:SRPBCC domain-containing protein [Flavilitoribacter nigricans]
MEDISQRTMEITRTFEAPVELLWKVLTTPEYIKIWWGPEGFTNTIRKMEVRKGGEWEFTMHGPDGTDFVNTFHYLEVTPKENIVMEHRQHPKFIITVRLFSEGDRTKVIWQNIFDSVPTMEEAIRAFQVDVGLVQNMERLGQYLQQQQQT